MTKALKVTMNLYGAVGTLLGLAYMLIPRQALAMEGLEGDASPYLISTRMVFGGSIFAVGIFLFIAARNPIKHDLWVKFAIVYSALLAVLSIFIGMILYNDISQVLVGMLINGGFAVALLAFYPWRVARSDERAASH